MATENSDETGEGAGVTPYRFGFVVLPNFNMLALASAIDPLRVANYLRGKTLYGWRILSIDGSDTQATNHMRVKADGAITDADNFDAVYVCSTWTPDYHYSNADLFAWLRRLDRKGVLLGSLGNGALVLARASLLNGYRATAHWEDLAAFAENFPKVDVTEHLYEIDRNRATSASGTTPLDLFLYLIQKHHGLRFANAVAYFLFHHKIREAHEEQQLPAGPRLGVLHRGLASAISIMEQTVESPLPLLEVADRAGLSLRHLERLFRTHLSKSVHQLYVEFRLKRAREFLTQTGMTVLEVAFACGFSSQEHFSRRYKAHFGLTPRNDRARGHRFPSVPL